MTVLKNILRELSKDYITEHIEKPHNNARISFNIASNFVPDDASFENLIGEYYNHQFTKCISEGGKLSRAEATGRAKDIVFEHYNRKGLDKLNAYSDAKKGQNGGVMAMIDIIWERLLHDAKASHVREVIDRYIAPSEWDERVELIRDIFEFHPNLNIDRSKPEKYASNYEVLIKALVESLDKMKDKFN